MRNFPKKQQQCFIIPFLYRLQRSLLIVVCYCIIINVILPVTATAQQIETCPTVIFDESFDGNILNESIWSFENGDGCNQGHCGWGNNELQWFQSQNAIVRDGKLIIEVVNNHDKVEGSNNNNQQYTSSRVTTLGKLDFGPIGRFEARIKLPVQTNIHSNGIVLQPRFFMLPTAHAGDWSRTAEDHRIDIMEPNIGHNEEEAALTNHSTIHFGELPPRLLRGGLSWSEQSNYYHQTNTKSLLPPLDEYSQTIDDDSYHIFAIEREHNKIRWLLDDVLYRTVTKEDIDDSFWPFDKQFYFVLDVAVVNNDDVARNSNVSTRDVSNSTIISSTPSIMEVDYVRVWQGSLPSITGSSNININDNEEGPVQKYAILNGILDDDAVYTWMVPTGAVILSGQGTDTIYVDFSNSTTSMEGLKTVVSATVHYLECEFNRTYEMDVMITQGSTTTSSSYDHDTDIETHRRRDNSNDRAATAAVVAANNNNNNNIETEEQNNIETEMDFSMINFDEIDKARYDDASGRYSSFLLNPQISGINPSLFTGRYERNGNDEWDWLIFTTSTSSTKIIEDASDYTSSKKFIYLDVYTDTAPVGSHIVLTFEDSTRINQGFPAGRHSRYIARTSMQGEWERLIFQYLDRPDAITPDNTIDLLVIQLGYGTYTNDVYYIDNLDSYSRVDVDDEDDEVNSNNAADGDTIQFVAGTDRNGTPANDNGDDVALPSDVESSSFDEFDVLVDFHSGGQAMYCCASGVMDQTASNPDQSGINTSKLCGRYQRDAANRWDWIHYFSSAITDASVYLYGTTYFTMDVYTENAAIGSEIILTLVDDSITGRGYPVGRHSRYVAYTTTQNQWERITFTFFDRPDDNVPDTSIDAFVIQLGRGDKTSDVYYIDNLHSNTIVST